MRHDFFGLFFQVRHLMEDIYDLEGDGWRCATFVKRCRSLREQREAVLGDVDDKMDFSPRTRPSCLGLFT